MAPSFNIVNINVHCCRNWRTLVRSFPIWVRRGWQFKESCQLKVVTRHGNAASCGRGGGGAGLKCGRLGHCGGSRAVWLETLSPILIPRTGLSCNVHCSHTCCCLPYVVRKICLKVWIPSIFHSTRSLCFEEWKMNLILDTEWPSQYWSCPPSTSTNTPHNGNMGVRTTLYFLTVFQSASLTTVLKK